MVLGSLQDVREIYGSGLTVIANAGEAVPLPQPVLLPFTVRLPLAAVRSKIRSADVPLFVIVTPAAGR